jgi:hypothetical protein
MNKNQDAGRTAGMNLREEEQQDDGRNRLGKLFVTIHI